MKITLLHGSLTLFTPILSVCLWTRPPPPSCVQGLFANTPTKQDRLEDENVLYRDFHLFLNPFLFSLSLLLCMFV